MSKDRMLALSKKHKGSILAYSLIILAMMLAIATSLSVTTIIEKKGASSTEFSTQSLQTADSGVQLALKKINNNLTDSIIGVFGSCSGGVVADLGDAGAGLYTLTLYLDENGAIPVDCNANLANEIKMIKSVGVYKNTVRAVNVAVVVACPATVIADGITYKTIVATDGNCWLDRNLGVVTDPGSLIGPNDANGYGWLFQWGRSADGHQIAVPPSAVFPGPRAEVVPTAPFDGKFLTPAWYNGPSPNSLWQGISGVNNPCPAGFRLPVAPEWETVSASILNLNDAFNSILKLTTTGRRNGIDGNPSDQGISGNYWSSTIDAGNPVELYFDATSRNPWSGFGRSTGAAVRCIQD